MQALKNIAVVGSGNIAHHFTAAFYQHGYRISAVISRNEITGPALAGSADAHWLRDPAHCPEDADLIFIAVTDAAIDEISAKLPQTQAIVVHTSGSTGMEALSRFPRYGVFYPLQSFSVNKAIDLIRVPLLVEGNNPGVVKALLQLADTLSDKVYDADSLERKYLHLSAVFAANFSNALYGVAKELLEKNTRLDFDLLVPLIEETAHKVKLLAPKDAQTGPAKRKDEQVINLHLELLKQEPEYSHLYKTLTALIKTQQQ